MINELKRLILETIDNKNITLEEKLNNYFYKGLTPREAFYLDFTDEEIQKAVEANNSLHYDMENYTVSEDSLVDKEILKLFVITKEELHQLKIKNQLFFRLIEFEMEFNIELFNLIFKDSEEINDSIEEVLNNCMNKIYTEFNLELRK